MIRYRNTAVVLCDVLYISSTCSTVQWVLYRNAAFASIVCTAVCTADNSDCNCSGIFYCCTVPCSCSGVWLMSSTIQEHHVRIVCVGRSSAYVLLIRTVRLLQYDISRGGPAYKWICRLPIFCTSIAGVDLDKKKQFCCLEFFLHELRAENNTHFSLEYPRLTKNKNLKVPKLLFIMP